MSKTSDMMAELAKKTAEQKEKLEAKENKLGDNSVTPKKEEPKKEKGSETPEQKKEEPKVLPANVKSTETPKKEEENTGGKDNSQLQVTQRVSDITWDGLLGGFIEFLNEPEKISSRVNNSVYLDDDAFEKLTKMESVMSNFVDSKSRNSLNKKVLLGKIVKFFYEKNVDELRKMQVKSIRDLKI